ncbi:MAG TPA: helix-turn-helix domain-containing protein [Solirubrobacteraceae bacterium]|jgi:hypothetical protein|nr:helix-turn-helix domain-containing protein [Solirubrobacteraceae bacterium]
MRKQVHHHTPKQLDVVRWTASLGAITAEALALRLGVSSASARGRLSVLQRRGLLSRHKLFVEAPALFTVTRAGLRASEAHGIKRCELSAGGAHHLAVCAMVAAGLELCYPDHRLVGERELRRDERDLGRPLASAAVGWAETGASGVHYPDLVLWPSDAHSLPVAVEVELTIKSPRRLAGICRAWARCRWVAGVLYLVDDPVRPPLERAIEHARASEQVVVVPLNALPQPTD